MVWLLGHRQPKGAATAMLRPTSHRATSRLYNSPLTLLLSC